VGRNGCGYQRRRRYLLWSPWFVALYSKLFLSNLKKLLGSKPEDYGKQRVWGSIGWGIFSMIAGFLVDETSKGQTEKNYAVVFYMALGIILIDFLVCTKLKVQF
jgi:exosortase/archaeosortase